MAKPAFSSTPKMWNNSAASCFESAARPTFATGLRRTRYAGFKNGRLTASHGTLCVPLSWRWAVDPVRFHSLQGHIYGVFVAERHETSGQPGGADGMAY